MAKTNINDIRNIGIIAHIDAGKTTTTEGILFRTGMNHKIGAVHDGETITDWMDQEKERGITIVAASITCYWEGKQINIIDTPGHVDFTVEVERSMRVLDGAVVVFDGKSGVEAQTETVWRQANKYSVPRICFINKINQTGGDFYKSLKSIHDRLSKRAVPVHLPIGFEKSINGIVDLIEMKAYTYKEFDDKELVVGEIPEDMLERAKNARSILVETAVEFDDDLLMRFLEKGEESITTEEVRVALRKAVVSGEVFLVSGGDGRGVIVEKLLDLMVEFLPSPVDNGTVWGEDPKTGDKISRDPKDDEPFSGIAFKLVNEPFGKLCYFRCYSGVLKTGTYVFNSSTGQKERVGRIVRPRADQKEDIDEIRAGDIAAIVGIKGTTTGHTLCDQQDQIILESIDFPEPPVAIAIEPKTKQDQEKMSVALRSLAEEDPTFRVSSNHETGQTIIAGMGELHLEILVERMKREFKVEANIGAPQVAYRETVKKTAEAQGKLAKQSGGRGQFGDVHLRIEPLEAGEGFEFVDEIKGGAVPKEYISAVKAGIEEAMASGVIAGYPVVDVRVALYDGSYHDVDSSELAFKIAASIGLKNVVRNAAPIITEPVMKVTVTTPEEFMGDVIGDLNARRGQIESMEDANGAKEVIGFVPLENMFGYTTDIRSMSQGRAQSVMELDHYAEVPPNVAQEIIAKRGKGGEDEQ